MRPFRILTLRQTLRRSPLLAAYLCLLMLFYGSDGQLLASTYAHSLRVGGAVGEPAAAPAGSAGWIEGLQSRGAELFEGATRVASEVSQRAAGWWESAGEEGHPVLASQTPRPLRLAQVTSETRPQASRPVPTAAEAPPTPGERERGPRLRSLGVRVPGTSTPGAATAAGATVPVLPLHRVERQAETREVGTLATAAEASTAVASAPPPRRSAVSRATLAPELVTLADSLDNSPGRIFAYVHDGIAYEPHWGASAPPVGTLWSGRGSSWEQAWLLQELLLAAGVDARLEWGTVEVTPEILQDLTGVSDLFRAGDLLTTSGIQVVLLVDGGRVIAARLPHVWVKAHLDYIPNRGATAGDGDTWVRLDPTLKFHDEAYGTRIAEEVPFVLGEHLTSGTELFPREDHEEALLGYAGANGVPATTVEDLKPVRSVHQAAFPFVPGTLRAGIVSLAGEAESMPEAFQPRLDLAVREAAGSGTLLSFSTGLAEVWGGKLELAWPGATSSDESTLEFYGGVFSTPPYEVTLRPSVRLDGVELATGTGVGGAEDVEVTATITPPDGVPTFAFWELFAGEPGVLTVAFTPTPREVTDSFAEAQALATDGDEALSWGLARAAGEYLGSLGRDLGHLGELRWHRVVNLGTATLALQRGAVSVSSDGTPVTFVRGPLSVDVGAMPLGLFPAEGARVPTVSTLELLGSQGSVREGEALTAAFGGEHVGAVTFLTRAVREGQTLTLVDGANLEEALAAAELSPEAEAHVRHGIGQGLVAWIPEAEIEIGGWETTGYVLEDPSTGAALYLATFQRTVPWAANRVVFHAPRDLDVVTAPTEVVASIEAEDLQDWTLSTRPTGEGATTVIASGTGAVDQLALGELDPTILLNGMHDLVLTGTDAFGETMTGRISVVVEGGMKIGNFTLSFVDLEVPLAGLPIQVVRTYDSRDRRVGDFGWGWSLDVRQGSYVNNRRPGAGWQILEGFLPCQQVAETASHLTTVRLSDREVYRFRTRLTRPAIVSGGCYATAGFAFVDGPVPGATLEILGNTQVFYQNGTNHVVDADTFEAYEPRAVRLTTRDGRVFDLDVAQGVTRLAEPNGNSLTINDLGVTHSSGASITFTRDTEGRITAIADPAGETLAYGYDGAGDLLSVTDRLGLSTSFTYAAGHYLTDIVDARGVTPIRNEYDADGRLTRHVDAFGKVIEYDHRLADRQEIVTNRLGQSRLLAYDERGNVVREVDELGRETLRSFDGEDNLLSETDPLGNTTSYAYTGANDLASVTDPLGNTTAYAYDGSGRVTAVTDPLGRVTTNAYDASGNLLSTTDPTGAETSFTYDAVGNLRSETDAAGTTTTYGYDGRGNLLTQTDATGHPTSYGYDAAGNRTTETTTRTLADGTSETLTTTFRYDAEGRLTETIQPDGSSTSTTYDALGQVTEAVDPLGRKTTFTYDQLGRQTGTAYPDGTSESRSYDAEGRLETVTDRGSRVTGYLYDASGRLVQTVFPDGTSTSSTYDAAGRLVATTDPRGNTTTYVYDAAGRRTRVLDALGGQTDFAYDAAGNQVAVTDPNRHTTSFVYDEAGRLVETLFPDGSERTVAYDALGRRTAETDQAGLTTAFGYDELGRLTTVTDALGQVTAYAYDELGNRLSQTDANGHATSFAYDALGRQTARTLPDGATESMAYDAAGSLVGRTDFLGRTTTFAYDVASRLVAKTYPDGSSVSFTYTDTGRRATMADARGTTTYGYDTRDRLVETATPDGRSLAYAYDAAGNRTTLTAQVAGRVLTTTYAYDALNRLETVTDPEGRSYTHGYDASGNRASLSHPNGVDTTYSYDPLNRLTDLSTSHSVSGVVQADAFTLGAAGNRTAIAEHDGTVRSYGYDALYRLTGETVVDGGGSEVYAKTFGYDPVGNRLEQATTGLGAGTVTYSYDERDRLLDEGGQAYSWDANGNLTAKAAEAAYAWDFEDRLETVTLDDGTVVTHTYDADGVRVRTETTPPGGETEVVDYLVDTSGPLSQVVAESTVEPGTGAVLLTAYYVRGDDLLSVMRPDGAGWASRFYHADGLGSIRALTDEAGVVTDRWTYTAFGELLEHDGEDPNAYLFAGEMLDPNSGFYYNRARWMDPGVGRFVSVDPFGGRPFEPLTLHKYLYASLDPLNVIDPTGRESLSSQLAAVVARGQLAIGSTLGALRVAFQAGDGGAIGRLFVQLGARAQAVALEAIQLFPRIQVGTAQLLRRSLDYSLRLGRDRFALLEAKYSIPRGTQAFNRLIDQLQEGVAMLPELAAGAQQARVVFWTYRAPRSLAEVKRVQDALGPVAKEIQFVHGVEGLFSWIRLFFGI